MRRSLAILFALLLASLPALSQAPEDTWRIDFDSRKDVEVEQDQKGVFITVRFRIIPPTAAEALSDRDSYEIQILEDDVLVKTIPVPVSKVDGSIVLAVDASEKMSGANIEDVRSASKTFLENLPDRADCGLLLFNDKMLPPEVKPGKDREALLRRIQHEKPRGGNSCFDAAARAIEMLKGLPNKKTIVLVTNGLDRNSQTTAEQVIARAKEQSIQIYTIGVGREDTPEPVYSALVLDHSGSMNQSADNEEKVTKIDGLHRAGKKFVDGMPSESAYLALIPFSDTVEMPEPFSFSNDKEQLIRKIDTLAAKGETALFDAIFAAVATLEAKNPDGHKRRIVAMTDGIDNKSRRRVEEVIDRARAANVPLFLIGLGREKEIDEKTMRRMAQDTNGKYVLAHNEKELVEVFREFSHKIHEEVIDEEKLRKIAEQTGGEYYPAKDVEKLKNVLKTVSNTLKPKDYEEKFASRDPTPNGLRREAMVKLVKKTQGKEEELAKVKGHGQVHGVVIAEMNHMFYLLMLVIIGALIGLPAWLGKKA